MSMSSNNTNEKHVYFVSQRWFTGHLACPNEHLGFSGLQITRFAQLEFWPL
jgi:hypothetical protein